MARGRRARRDAILSGGASARVLILGLGFSGQAIAVALRQAGVDQIIGTTRQAETAPAGTRIVAFDGNTLGSELRAAVEVATHLLVSIPPDAAGDPVLRCVGAAIKAAGCVRWVGYLSTIGVYGDHAGRWIDENAPCRPANQRSRHRLAAEEAWRGFAGEVGARLAVFRLAGIYGRGRSPLDNLAAGTAHRIVKPGQVFNRIHVADLATIVAESLMRGTEGVFNVADDEPAPPQDVVTYAAGLLGVTPPPEIPFAEASLSPMALSFYGENKRVRNHRIKAELGVALAFPTYREGLTALARDRALNRY